MGVHNRQFVCATPGNRQRRLTWQHLRQRLRECSRRIARTQGASHHQTCNNRTCARSVGTHAARVATKRKCKRGKVWEHTFLAMLSCKFADTTAWPQRLTTWRVEKQMRRAVESAIKGRFFFSCLQCARWVGNYATTSTQQVRRWTLRADIKTSRIVCCRCETRIWDLTMKRFHRRTTKNRVWIYIYNYLHIYVYIYIYA